MGFGIALACLVAFAEAKGSNGAKYILHVVIDDLGWADAWNSKHIETPNLDKLAKDSILLDRMYASPMCAPSRASMFTGRHPASLGYYRNPSEDARLPDDCQHLPKHLEKLGFKTHLVGKWHLPWHSPDQLPSGHLVGFNSFFGYLHWGMDYYSHEFPPAVHTGPVACRGFDIINSSTVENSTSKRMEHIIESPGSKFVGIYADQLFANEALRLIDAHDKENPLYLCVAFQGLHDPYQAPEGEDGVQACLDHNVEDSIQQKCLNYSKMVTKVDSLVGSLVDRLKHQGMWESTAMLVHTDNGGALAWTKDSHLGGASSNFPLRGGKFTLWDGGLRVRGLLHSNMIPKESAGKTWDGLMYISDVLKTVLGIAGVPEDHNVFRKQYNSLTPTFNMWSEIRTLSKSPREQIVLQPLNDYWHGDHCSEAWVFNPYHPHCGAALLKWPYKLIIGIPGDRRRLHFNFSSRFSWTPSCEEEVAVLDLGALGKHEARLFNVEEDPSESHNLMSPDILSHNIFGELDDVKDGVDKYETIVREMLFALIEASKPFPPPTMGSDLSPPPEEACIKVESTGSWRPWELSAQPNVDIVEVISVSTKSSEEMIAAMSLGDGL